MTLYTEQTKSYTRVQLESWSTYLTLNVLVLKLDNCAMEKMVGISANGKL